MVLFCFYSPFWIRPDSFLRKDINRFFENKFIINYWNFFQKSTRNIMDNEQNNQMDVDPPKKEIINHHRKSQDSRKSDDNPMNNSNSSNNKKNDDSQKKKRSYVFKLKPEDRKKRGPRPKDVNAPRAPVNAYVRFLNDNRERVRKENPDMAFGDITKTLSSLWAALSEDDKKVYVDAHEKDKAAYRVKMEEYKKSDAYKQFINEQLSNKDNDDHDDADHDDEDDDEDTLPAATTSTTKTATATPTATNSSKLSKKKKIKKPSKDNNNNKNTKSKKTENNKTERKTSTDKVEKTATKKKKVKKTVLKKKDSKPSFKPASSNSMAESLLIKKPAKKILKHDFFDFPIFTEEFLEHNRVRDQELRNIRKVAMDNEEENAILTKHNEDMLSRIEYMTEEIRLEEQNTKELEKLLNHISSVKKAFQIDPNSNSLTPEAQDKLLELISNL